MKKLLLSVVIPTYNEEKGIGKCIESLKNQSYDKVEIIIVDDGSKDKTREIVKSFKNVRLIESEHKGTGFSRNLGARKANGDILIFVDADMTFDKDYLKYLVKPIIEEKAIGTEEETQIAVNSNNIWSKCQGRLMSDPKKEDRRIFRAILKSKFMELGGFDIRYGYADDQTFYLKYGLKSKIARKAICYHRNPETLKEVYRQSTWIGASINFFEMPVLKYLAPILLFLAFPAAIPLLSINKAKKIKNFRILHYMVVFMTVRYFGTIKGIFKKIYLKKNFR